ncbi:hypothetical protein B0H10DRAFT_2129417 [Mycena sp. CBHHK59/15]|nr:hypothetical protein B0H10DRAFT_2129417 [Mycena sp. CBHHK59/15]
MTHDDDWSDILGDYSEIESPADFLQQIDDQFAIAEKDGATFLVSKLAYSGNSSTDDVPASASETEMSPLVSPSALTARLPQSGSLPLSFTEMDRFLSAPKALQWLPGQHEDLVLINPNASEILSSSSAPQPITDDLLTARMPGEFDLGEMRRLLPGFRRRLNLDSPLASIHTEVLERVAYEVTFLQPLGPPSGLVPLLLTCKTVNDRLSGNPALYARIFRFKFDSSAVRRRAFDPTPAQYHDQLVLYCTQLQKLRGLVRDDCDEVLFCAYLMMLENDGRNAAQLAHAGLDSYLDIFVRTRLLDDRHKSHGWPSDNVASACALWLVWMTTTEAKLKEESAARRNQIIQLVLPYVLVPYRYASAFAPQQHFNLPLLQNAIAVSQRQAHSIVTAHGPYPIYLDPSRAWSQLHFGSRLLMAPPLVTVAAKLVYFSRRETVPFNIPPHLPLNREAALKAGRREMNPTQEDIREVNAHLNIRLPEVRPGWGGDEGESGGDEEHPLNDNWDSDWWRLRKCFDVYDETDRRLGPCYVPGTFTGLWQGRMIIPSEDHFSALVTTREYPPAFDEAYVGATTLPIFMRIAEHHSYAPHTPAPCPAAEAGWDDGLANAFFPPGVRFVQTEGRERGKGLTVRANIDGEDRGYEYATYDPNAADRDGGAGAGASAHHDPVTCMGCRAQEEGQRTARLMAAAAAHEELFARVGMGRAGEGGAASTPPQSDADADGGDADADEKPAPAHGPARVQPCTGIQDIIFTGATDLRHGQAWNHFEFYGRVRLWDGLIGILRVSPDPRLGTLFFYGFVVGGHKFVGNWRVAGQDVGVPAYESAFSMARRDD